LGGTINLAFGEANTHRERISSLQNVVNASSDLVLLATGRNWYRQRPNVLETEARLRRTSLLALATSPRCQTVRVLKCTTSNCCSLYVVLFATRATITKATAPGGRVLLRTEQAVANV
jgi:hypothetical protein